MSESEPESEPEWRSESEPEPEWRSDDFAPWDGKRVPVTLIGGYLGAGKTTVVNRLLARTDRPIAVLVNDVGAINVDAKLVARRHGDTIELTDGCICCSLGRGMAEAFEGLRARALPPDHLVIEMSGVADPARVVPWANSPGFRLDGVVVLVDCDQWRERSPDPLIGPALRAQLVRADLVVLTKTDLATSDHIAEVEVDLAAMVPGVPVIDAGGAEAAAGLLDLATRRPGGVDRSPVPTLFDVHETSLVPMPDPVDRFELDRLLDHHCTGALRAKAVVRLTDGSSQLVQVVGRRREITPLPMAEHQTPTDLVVIRARSMEDGSETGAANRH